jgi:triacylglycerol lipase
MILGAFSKGVSVTQERNPVVLVHGIFDTHKIFHKMTAYLRKWGWKVYALDLSPNNGKAGLDELAKQLASYIDATFTPEQPVDIVGFSMGGLVSRYYVQCLGGIKRVQRFITISSPHHGTITAYFPQNDGGKQMRPNSLFLEDLNQNVMMLEKINFTSIWTPFDLMIIPSKSSQMPVGKEVIVPVGLHAWMINDFRCLNIVMDALAEPIN